MINQVRALALSKLYERHRALHDVSFSITAGDVLGLLGPNGAGKTTLLWLLSTLSRPSSGELFFGTLRAEEFKQARRDIGLLSHKPLSYGELSGFENLVFFAQLHGLTDIKERAEAALLDMDLAETRSRLTKTYSRGMLQRLGLALAMLHAPSLLLLDEPFTGLDARSTRKVIDHVLRQREKGTMVVVVSHDMTTTAEIANRYLILQQSRVARAHDGVLTPRALHELYADTTERADAAVSPNASARASSPENLGT